MEEKKLTYEQLEETANGLLERNRVLTTQCQQMATRIKELSEFAAFKRLDYLFKVVEMELKFPVEFVEECVKEIVGTMTIPEALEEQPKETKEEE